MRYFGGKSKIAKELVPIIESYRGNHVGYLEPFVGGSNVISLVKGLPRFASDKYADLIAMWIKLQEGWIPPADVSKEEYLEIRKTGEDFLKGFVSTGCSFGGKVWGGYAGLNEDRNYALNAKNSVLKKIKLMQDVEFTCKSFEEIKPDNLLIYCDPPYSGTTKYTVEFDEVLFWQWVRKYSKNNTILISEYNAPEGFKCVWQKEVRTDMNSSNGKIERVEKLFKYEAKGV